MGKILGHLEPAAVWSLFEEICSVPRPSKKEGKILEWLTRFAIEHSLEYSRDTVGNMVIRKPATKGLGQIQPLVMQSHVDMVCEKNADVKHDFDNDPITPWVDGEWVKARGTTLGADNGIGMAFALAILQCTNIQHGPIECLFTVDEETGLTGAFKLEPGFVQGRLMLNLDSEDDGELCIGCAGGLDTVATFRFQRVSTEPDHIAYRIRISGLQGGHSGEDINKGRGNANKILNRLLWSFERMFEMRLAQIDGGNLRNAIAREAFALISIPRKFQKDFEIKFDEFVHDIAFEQKTNEPGLKISRQETALPDCLLDFQTQTRLLSALYVCPHGVMGMSPDIPGLVETSTNLASVKMTPGEIIISTSQRSSIATLKRDVADMTGSAFTLAGARVKHGDGYPGWTPNLDSKMLAVMKNAYLSLFGKEPKVIVIHAGLECGLIGEKFPGMDMISFGPTMRGVHSPDEKLNIASVQRSWAIILETLRNIPAVQ